MNGDKVIRVTFGERVEQAKKKAEEEYQEKLERSKQSDVDVRDFFDDEELDRILSDNEFFNGRVADLRLSGFRRDRRTGRRRFQNGDHQRVGGIPFLADLPGGENARNGDGHRKRRR